MKEEFRAWDKVEKRMRYRGLIDYWLKHPEVYEVQQYVGKRDKNKKKIYKGDILSLFFEGDYVGDGEVKYDDDKCRFCINGFGGDENWEMHELMVIGNKYENPNLIG